MPKTTWIGGSTRSYGGNHDRVRSPVERLNPKDLIGEREARERTLLDDGLRAVWNATETIGYRYGDIFKLLMLTGQREREVADMRWSEIDIGKKLWTIPAERMKGGRAHEVPLAPAALALIGSLPRFTGGGSRPHDYGRHKAGKRVLNG